MSSIAQSRLVRRTLLAFAALVTAIAWPPAPSHAQTPDRGLFGIAPAKVLIVTRPPRDVRPLQLTNTTRLTYDVRVFAAPLRQAADGGLTYDSSPRARSLARRTLRLSDTRFTMAPNSRRELSVRWLRTLPRKRVAPMAVVVRPVPRGVEQGAVRADYRIVGTYLLRLPGGRRGGRFVGLTPEQGPGRTLTFTARVRNTGEVYDEPRGGRMTIRDARGRTMTRASFKGEIILPGAERPFAVTTRKPLAAGRYSVTASMRFGASRRVKRITRRFELVGTNRLPTTRLRIVGIEAAGYVGEPARAVVRVRNTGNRRTEATIRTRLVPAEDGRRAARPADAATETRTLAAGEQAEVAVELGELGDHDYDVDATAAADGRSFGTSTISITPRPNRSWWQRFGRFVADNAVLIIALFALLVVVAVAEYTRRYRRRLGAQAAAPAGDARRANGRARRVNLNQATADELAELPGIGPNAAQRIVEHRDEYGRFASVDELGRVEGFDPARVAAVGDRLAV